MLSLNIHVKLSSVIRLDNSQKVFHYNRILWLPYTVGTCTYNQSDTEQLGVCTVKLRHKDECSKCRFFALPGDGPALLGMQDMKLLDMLSTCAK